MCHLNCCYKQAGRELCYSFPFKGAVLPRQECCPCLSQQQPALILHQVQDLKTGNPLPAPTRAEARQSHCRTCDFPDAQTLEQSQCKGNISQHYSPLSHALLLAGNYAIQIILNKNAFKINSSRDVKIEMGKHKSKEKGS